MRFSANTVLGAGRGKALGYPTLNLSLDAIPTDLLYGIYAGWALIDGKKHQAAIHYGPRPVFETGVAFELHLLDTILDTFPENVTVETVRRLRDIENFSSLDLLRAAIAKDIADTRAILADA